MKPEKPITRKEMYLDVATGGSTELPSPVTREEKYLAKIAGKSVDVPTPVTRYEMLLAAVAGESYTLAPVTRLEIYLAKAAGQDVEIPQPVTREEMYWFDYCGGTPTPPEREYTGAVPVTITADGTPLLDYLISGNTVQSGTPTPDNPIMPQGTGERTANLFDKDARDTIKGYILNEYLRNNGETTSSAGWRVSEYIDINEMALYTLDYNGSYNAPSICFYDNNKNFISGAAYSGRLIIPIETPEGAKYCRFSFRDTAKENIMFNEGSALLPYEPFGVKIPFSSANTTTPVYLGEVQTTRKIKKVVFDGTEVFYASGKWGKTDTAVYYTTLPNALNLSTNVAYVMCSHYVGKSRNYIYDNDIECSGMTGGNSITFRVSRQYAGTKEDFLAYLAAQYANGTPVTIWYVLAEPETGIVNEPLQKIGEYADTVSMEQAGAQIPTANGSTTLDVETTVKPSEVYIKYRGEAVDTLSALSAEVSSPEATPENANPEETEEEENGSEDISLQHEFEAIE